MKKINKEKDTMTIRHKDTNTKTKRLKDKMIKG